MSSLLDASKVLFLMCDLQAKLVGAMQDSENLILRARKLLELGKHMSVPLIVTEQYPKGLGPTVPDLDISHALLKTDKSDFSMYQGEVIEALTKFKGFTIVLFGIETHICVLQTVLELLQHGFQVHLVTDACSSRSAVDMRVALQRLQQAGAVLTTTETVMFELARSKDSPHFDVIRSLARTHIPDHPAL